jgi:transcriptional regulator with PAS, ATPase and Fis domain
MRSMGPAWAAVGANGSAAWSVRAEASSIVGSSAPLLTAIETAHRVAPTRLPVLIVGATGVGKELIARYVHQESGVEGQFVDLDCGALPEDLVEALLFGHKRGAFTGAVAHSEGLMELADGGTLFLDELGSLPLRGQAKLLRALETGEIRRVGATRPRRVSFRLVATMQDNAADLVREGGFRPDLFQRVAGAVIELPALAERPADVVPLARHFASCAGVEITSTAEAVLQTRGWPGNVRELRWTIERAALFATAEGICGRAIEAALAIGPERFLSQGGASELTRAGRLRAACLAHKGDTDGIARTLGIGRSTLYRWLSEAGLELRAFKDDSAH